MDVFAEIRLSVYTSTSLCHVFLLLSLSVCGFAGLCSDRCVLKIVVETLKDVHAAHSKVVYEDQQRQLDSYFSFLSSSSAPRGSPQLPVLVSLRPPPSSLSPSHAGVVGKSLPSSEGLATRPQQQQQHYAAHPVTFSASLAGRGGLFSHSASTASLSSSSASSSNLLVHHSRDSQVKQWDETLVIAIDGALMLLLSCGVALDADTKQNELLLQKEERKKEKISDGPSSSSFASSSSSLCYLTDGIISIVSSAHEILQIVEAMLLSSHYTPEILLTAAKTLTDILQLPQASVRGYSLCACGVLFFSSL